MVHSITLKSHHISSDGRLQVALPNLHDTDVDVIIVYQPAQEPKKRQWSSDFLSTFGAWQGESLMRNPQEEAIELEPLSQFYGCIQDDSFIRHPQNNEFHQKNLE
jgi:hypothetical protein